MDWRVCQVGVQARLLGVRVTNRRKDAVLGESLGGAQMSGCRPAIAIRATLEEKGVP
jgi:hypothetical protein